MDTRREFFKRAAQLAAGTGLTSTLLPSVEKAAAIAPAEDTTFLDAEHVVILMQENRSFDHCFGTLRGVRGFSDPRAVVLPDQNPVWLQTNATGEVYAPFRLDVERTNATWLGSLPHSWQDQNDAKNGGDHDKWLVAKPIGREHPAGLPLTMGYYTREDLPFYYALADAFTICDQHFCSSLTGTTPNRLYLWTGTIREHQNADSPANVRNENVDYGLPARWTTFPERLEDAGVSWKIYQNELSIYSGLSEEEDAWLTNFTDNPIEWFPQFAAEFAGNHRAHVVKLCVSLPERIDALEKQSAAANIEEERNKIAQELKTARELLAKAMAEHQKLSGTSFDQLPQRTQTLHKKAFAINSGDPDYRQLTRLRYQDGTAMRELQIPKGDVLYQFRADVTNGKLPTVSWIVAPEKLSDHPGAPWYGAWYVAEVMNILTHNPDVWKKTIFVLTYDENDGLFDHVPPFGAPDPKRAETGSVSSGIDSVVEYVTLEQDLAREPADKARGGSIGLGFRVPLIVASPWSRGGAVCSQVFDHTSVIRFLERFATHKSGKRVRESNISEWRRTICGDLTSVFQSAEEKTQPLPFPLKEAVIERIHNAKFKSLPAYQALSESQIAQARQNWRAASWMPRQEPGIRPARALPYELYAAGRLSSDRGSLQLTLAARQDRFGKEAAGAPFHVYAPEQYLHNGQPNRTRSYAIKSGQSLEDSWQLAGFPNGRYHLCVCGPNGFLVDLGGNAGDPLLEIETSCFSTAIAAQITFGLLNKHTDKSYTAVVTHNAYGFPNEEKVIPPGQVTPIAFNLQHSHGWYDVTIRIEGAEQFQRRYAGHVETGRPSFSDPQIG
ncbi:MAG TPA: phospholipase C, phosphocholine-specific [Bryobacteraceae bacterium]|jgi:phospholipase C|nr:phospholipase C, phosphocholine-specific [Bryobacteraceae bacterium]